MPAVFLHRRALVGASFATYVLAVFLAFSVFEVPGLGLGHLFYLPIVLLALATGQRVGALAGVAAASLYATGALINPHLAPSERMLSATTGIRLVSYTLVGAVIGWAAQDNRRLLERLRLLAERDPLTDLLNTRAFEEELSAAVARESAFSLLLGDVDDLKSVNDRLGHAAGNEYLVRLADSLRRTVRPGETIARVGGDEFAILAPAANATDAEAACRRLERILAAHGVAVSFGWAFHPGEGEDPLALFRAADKRLYGRKLAGERPERARATLHAVS